MPTEVFAFDINIANQNFQTNTANSNSGSSSQAEPGLFESIISEYTQVSQEEISQEEIISQVPEQDFSGEQIVNVFSQPLLNIIAPINDDVSQAENHVMQIPEFLENLKNFTPEQIDTLREILTPENLEQIVNLVMNNAELTEELQSKLEFLPQDFVQKIQGVIQSLADRFIVDDGDESLKVGIQHLARAFGSTVNELMDANGFAKTQISGDVADVKIADVSELEFESEAESEVEAESESESEVRSKKRNKNSEANPTDAAIAISASFPAQQTEAQTSISDANAKQNQTNQSITLTNQNPNPKLDAKSEPENKAITAQNVALENANSGEIPENPQNNDNSNVAQKNFREMLENRISERQQNSKSEHESGYGSESESESESFLNQNNRENQNFFGANNSRDRNVRNSRFNSNDTRQNSRVNTRNEYVRNDFQNFFEGVLNNRRTLTTSQAQPLDLRTNLNLSRSESLSNGIVNVVRFIRADGLHKANIIIDPPALGRITIELTSTSSGVEASVKVNSEQIRQLIQDQISQLRMNLSRQGVQVTEFTVDVQQDNANNQQNSQQQNQHRFFSQANFVNDDDFDPESEDFRIDLEQGLLYWVA